MRKRTKRIIGTAAAFFAVVGMLVGARLLYVQEQGNFHVVTIGEVYRSAQLDRDGLNRYIPAYGIRSIVNLRGEHDGAGWYKEEIKASDRYHVRHYDVRLSADKAPDAGRVRKLIKIFRTAPRPVLLHCKAGADRAGLASAMWLTVIDSEPKDVASQQLSIKYGHMPVGPTQALDRFFAKWTPPEGSQESF